QTQTIQFLRSSVNLNENYPVQMQITKFKHEPSKFKRIPHYSNHTIQTTQFKRKPHSSNENHTVQTKTTQFKRTSPNSNTNHPNSNVYNTIQTTQFKRKPHSSNAHHLIQTHII